MEGTVVSFYTAVEGCKLLKVVTNETLFRKEYHGLSYLPILKRQGSANVVNLV